MYNIQQFRVDHLLQTLFINFSSKSVLNLFFHQLFPLLTLLLVILVLVGIILFIRKIISFNLSLKEPSILLELTPPANVEQSALMTEQLSTLLHSLGESMSLKDRILGRKPRFSLEIVSTHDKGIRYMLRTRAKNANTIHKALLSYLPSISIKTVEDYLPENLQTLNHSAILEFKLAKHFAIPLKKHDNLDDFDPIAYITGMMTKLYPSELLSIQLVVTPSKLREVKKIRKMIFKNGDVIGYLKKPKFLPFLGVKEGLINRSSFEQEYTKSVNAKINQPLFECSLRVFLLMKDKQTLKERAQGLISSFSIFSKHDDQSIIPIRGLQLNIFKKYLSFIFLKRLFGISNRFVLSVSEVSSIYHFPFTSVTKTENLVKTYSKQLPAPLSLKQAKELDITFAKNVYGGTTTQIGLKKDERRRHMYIIGATGTGKSTMILSMVNQDIKEGRGVAVIDPHGELAETVLQCIPEERKNDLIYVNPDDLQYPIGINLMELTPGLSEDDSLREKEFIAESVISLFRKVFASDMKGNPHRIEYILRNTIHTAFTVDNPTLFTIFELLNNPPYQKKVVAKLKDENLKNFWKFEYGKAGDYQKVKMVSPVTARIGRFLFSPSAKRMLEQPKSTINFDEILNGKILVCNLAKGKLGEDTSQVLGIMILNKLQLASLRRTRIPASERKDFYLYVDEFQHFATRSFVEMLSESRKYKLNLIIAEQSTSQQDDRDLVHIILANVGTVVCFKTANPEDEKLLLPQFEPYIDKGEIYNLPAFHFYMRSSALNPEEPYSGETILLNINNMKNKTSDFIDASRTNWAIRYMHKEVTADMPVVETENVMQKKTITNDGLPDDE